MRCYPFYILFIVYSGSLSVYLFDLSNGKYLSRIYRNAAGTVLHEAVKETPDVHCKFKMYVSGSKAVAFQADNGNK